MKREEKEKVELCAISGCNNESMRSLSSKKLSAALTGTSFKKESKRVKVCKEHYRKYKKETKKDRKLESLGW